MRLRADYVFGTTDVALTVGGTSLSSPNLTRLPAVATGDVAALTLHNATTAVYEVVWVTAHTAGATTATILRGQESSTAAAWPSGTTWLHGPTRYDWQIAAPNTAAMPATPPAVQDDEFDDSAGSSGPGNGLQGKWTVRSPLTTAFVPLAPSVIQLTSPTTGGYLSQVAPTGDFTASFRLLAGPQPIRQMIGPAVLDASGNGFCLCFDNPSSDSGTYVRSVTAYAQVATVTSVATASNLLWVQANPFHVSVRRVASSGQLFWTISGSDALPAPLRNEIQSGTVASPATVGILVPFVGATAAANRVYLDYARVT
jgi:hypothetical protein